MICLENPKMNSGSTIAIIQAKTTLAPVCKITVTVEPFWGWDQITVRTLTLGGTTTVIYRYRTY